MYIKKFCKHEICHRHHAILGYPAVKCWALLTHCMNINMWYVTHEQASFVFVFSLSTNEWMNKLSGGPHQPINCDHLAIYHASPSREYWQYADEDMWNTVHYIKEPVKIEYLCMFFLGEGIKYHLWHIIWYHVGLQRNKGGSSS